MGLTFLVAKNGKHMVGPSLCLWHLATSVVQVGDQKSVIVFKLAYLLAI